MRTTLSFHLYTFASIISAYMGLAPSRACLAPSRSCLLVSMGLWPWPSQCYVSLPYLFSLSFLYPARNPWSIVPAVLGEGEASGMIKLDVDPRVLVVLVGEAVRLPQSKRAIPATRREMLHEWTGKNGHVSQASVFKHKQSQDSCDEKGK